MSVKCQRQPFTHCGEKKVSWNNTAVFSNPRRAARRSRTPAFVAHLKVNPAANSAVAQKGDLKQPPASLKVTPPFTLSFTAECIPAQARVEPCAGSTGLFNLCSSGAPYILCIGLVHKKSKDWRKVWKLYRKYHKRRFSFLSPVNHPTTPQIYLVTPRWRPEPQFGNRWTT